VVNGGLIFDVGTSEGNDTEYYLAKGFRVVSVEADPLTFAAYNARFDAEIKTGKLISFNCAASSTAGKVLEFWRNDKDQGVSSLKKSGKERYVGTQTAYEVTSIDWNSLCGVEGVPYYAKVDIEGGEVDFLSGIDGMDQAPEYLSAETKSIEVLDQLYRIGYRKFKIVDQKAIRHFKAPNPAQEGVYVSHNNSNHGSGLFGKELPGANWMTFEDAVTCFKATRIMQSQGTVFPTWYDFHAWADRFS
jgi:FkbM family methyltransferase